MWKLVLAVLAVALPACMSITHGRSQTIEVQTSPPGARVTIRPVHGDLVSPASVTLLRKPGSTINVPDARSEHVSYLVTASLPGYRDTSVPVESAFAARTWVRNLVWINPALMCVGVAVDVGTGAAYELTPSSIFIELEPVGGTPVATK